jgi:hypothetical protein
MGCLTDTFPDRRNYHQHLSRQSGPAGTDPHPGNHPLVAVASGVPGRRSPPPPSPIGPGSAHAMQPGHRGAVGGAAERFQCVVPARAEELVKLVGKGLRVAGSGGQRP